jgi:hypothetical protein
MLLILVNVLWSGLGNLSIGDKRGWAFMLANILFFIISLFTFFIPSLLFFAYCCYAGYQFLIAAEASASNAATS